MRAILPIDPATLSTAQQKVLNFKTKRIITNPRVARAMRVVRLQAEECAERARKDAEGDPATGNAVRLVIIFRFAIPKSIPKRDRADASKWWEGKPVTSAKYGDLDNRAKAFIDALVLAGWFADDHLISTLTLHKVYTSHRPCIEVSVNGDHFGERAHFSPDEQDCGMLIVR